MNKFLDSIRQGVVLGDGAMGTLLYQRGASLGSCFELLNAERPGEISRVHEDYLRAGAQLIETNTFGANRVALERFGLAARTAELNERGASLARAAADSAGALVAGAVGPLPKPAEGSLRPPESVVAYREQVLALQRGGVDVLMFETFTRLDELEAVVRLAVSETGLPVVASIAFSDDGHTADGIRIGAALRRVREAGAIVAGLNCHFGPMQAISMLKEVEIVEGEYLSVYPNAGRPEYFAGRYIYHPVPRYFAEAVEGLVAQGARLIGGCCGTTPETIAAMAPVVARMRPISVKQALPRIELAPLAVPKAGVAAPTLLELWKKGLVVVTELDPPKTLGLEKLIEGSVALKEAGTDFVTLADNSLAVLRVSNLAAAAVLKDAGVETIVHLACRDRNILGLQSELMGMEALGLRHVLALTGDPAKVGDHPGASSVYDVNSIGLLKIISQLNEGRAANGRDLKGHTHLVAGCAFNPNARNLESQVRKLEDKIRAGAGYVLTQPIFDARFAKMVHEALKGFGLPVMIGVMPLLTGRNTEFLHNEVPGIVIPDSVRERMRGLEGAEGNRVGLEVAREICDAVLEYFNGAYLITPLMRYDLTVGLARAIRKGRLTGNA